jgi:hypothetical protein
MLSQRDLKWLKKIGLNFSSEEGVVEISPKLTYFGENLE